MSRAIVSLLVVEIHCDARFPATCEATEFSRSRGTSDETSCRVLTCGKPAIDDVLSPFCGLRLGSQALRGDHQSDRAHDLAGEVEARARVDAGDTELVAEVVANHTRQAERGDTAPRLDS